MVAFYARARRMRTSDPAVEHDPYLCGWTSGKHRERRGLLLLSCEQAQRKVSSFGDGNLVLRLSRHADPRRHDDRESGNAQGTNLLLVSW